MAIILTAQAGGLGTPQDDVILGQELTEGIAAGLGNDVALGFEGDDVIVGNEGDDVLDGGTGNDILSGDADDDQLFGRAGNDRMLGGQGNDQLNGGIGNDILVGGLGNDLLVGGLDRDEIEFNFAPSLRMDITAIGAPQRAQGNDIVFDFEPGNDHISVIGVFENLDTNRNDRLDDGDDRVSVDTEGFQRLVIDFTNAPLLDASLASGTITVLGVSELLLGRDISFDPAL